MRGKGTNTISWDSVCLLGFVDGQDGKVYSTSLHNKGLTENKNKPIRIPTSEYIYKLLNCFFKNG